MNRNHHQLYIIIIIIITISLCVSVQQTDANHAIKYKVINTVPNSPGGKLFNKEIGFRYSYQIMPNITTTTTIFRVFRQMRNVPDRRRVPKLTLYISEFQGYAYKNGNNINVSASALDKFYYPRSKSKELFYSLMVHEMTHVFQWHGEFTAPGGLTEGTADYVMIKSGSYNRDTKPYPKAGEGKRWDEGYGVTERFLEYCDSLLPHFTAELNKKMRYRYSDSFFVELLKKPVDQLWREYKAKYGNQPAEEAGYSINTKLAFHGLEY